MTDCKCKSPPCKCRPEDRGTECEHRIQGEYIEEQREHGIFKGWKMHNCGMKGKLYDDCNLTLIAYHLHYLYQNYD